MAKFTKASDLAKYQRERAERVKADTKAAAFKAAKKSAADVNAFAKLLLSGTTSPRQLAREGHPYSRFPGAKTVSRPLLPVNYQTGVLSGLMKVGVRKQQVNVYALRLLNKAPYAGYVLDPKNRGTKFTKARGFFPSVVDYARKINISNEILLAKRRAEKK